MSSPDWQQRVLDRMESALQASEPHLASMFAIFARLNAGEPVGAEPLARPRRRQPRRSSSPGTAVYAFVFIPLMFALIVGGALLGGGARNARACEAGYSVGATSPLFGQPSCQEAGKTATGKRSSGQQASGKQATANQATGKQATGKQATGKLATGKQATGKQATVNRVTGTQTASQSGASCIGAVPVAQSAAWTDSELAVSPPAITGAARGEPQMCGK